MGAREIETLGLGPVTVTAGMQRAAAVQVAARIAAEHPHELDDTMPRLAGRLIGRDPAIAAGLLEVLDALGLRTPARRPS